MHRLSIEDLRCMLRGVPAKLIDMRRVHFNSFVGCGGSDSDNRQRQDINEHNDDEVTRGNDVGSCVDDGLRGGGFGGGVRSWVVRESASVEGLVEGLSVAYTTTRNITKATTYDNDDDDDTMTTTKHNEPRSTPAMWTPLHGENSAVQVPDGLSQIKDRVCGRIR